MLPGLLPKTMDPSPAKAGVGRVRSCMICGAVLPEPVHANRKFCEPCAKKRIAAYKAS